MEVLSETPGELTVLGRPNVRLPAIAGILLCLIGLLIVAMTQTSVMLSGRRSGPHEAFIELSTRSWIGSTVSSIRTEDATDVVIERGLTRGSGGVVIRGRAGDLSLAALSSGTAQQLAATVRAFLDNPSAPNLAIRQDNRLFAYTMGPAVALLGLLLLALTSQRVRYTIDKVAGKISMERRSVFGVRRSEYPLNQIAAIQTQWVSRRRRGAVVWMVMTSGERVHAGWPDRTGTVGRIRTFLGMKKENRHEQPGIQFTGSTIGRTQSGGNCS